RVRQADTAHSAVTSGTPWRARSALRCRCATLRRRFGRAHAPAPRERPRNLMPDLLRIANAGGYWGDDLAQFRRQLELGPVDVVTLDFLAEITMSIMQKQRARDPQAGYARDFVTQVEQALPLLTSRGTRVITNAGGVNPLACREALVSMAERHGATLDVAAVIGDDLLA